MGQMVGKKTPSFLQAHEQLLPNSISPTSVSEMATRWDSMVGLRQARGEI